MKFKCQKSILMQIVNTVQKAIGSKSSLPILECIKIDAQSDGNIVFTANSIELCIEYNANVTVYESGSAALVSKIFGDIVRKLPDGEVEITVDPKNYVTDIVCSSSEFNIQGMNPEEFPAAPIVEEEYRTQLKHKTLKNIIRKVYPFISQMETRKPVLTGALFDFSEKEIKIVGTDLHRLAVLKLEADGAQTAKKLVIPGNTLAKISQLLSDEEDEKLDIIASEKHVILDFKDFQVYSRLLEGEFLKYDVILSAANSIKIKADKRSIRDSLERANLIINDDLSAKTENKMPVKLNISGNKIDISCKTVRGYVNDSVMIEHEGGDILIGLNCRFMLDALNACDEDEIMLEFSAPTSGCFIKPEDGSDKYTFMVLPVRI